MEGKDYSIQAKRSFVSQSLIQAKLAMHTRDMIQGFLAMIRSWVLRIQLRINLKKLKQL